MEETRLLRELRVIVALGRIAFDTLLRMLVGTEKDPGLWTVLDGGSPQKPPPFAHGVVWRIRPPTTDVKALWLVASYHPSRQNTQTGRLTRAMFDRIWRKVRELAHE
jgi:uracil-DNA glycosylase